MMDNAGQRSTWVTVDLQVIRNNVRAAITRTGTPAMAVVKANAYGHGMVPVARAALEAGAAWCAVARVEEALSLRAAGINTPTLILGHTPPGMLAEAIANDIALTVWDSAQVEAIASAARAAGREALVHLKIDTGMNRLGAYPEAAAALARKLAEDSHIGLQGAFTHLARADEEDSTPTDRQAARLSEALAAIQEAARGPLIVHAANSAGGLFHPPLRFDLIRIGVAMYGLHPSEARPLPTEFRPALSWQAVLSHVKEVGAGEGISYGHTYVTRRQERIGTVPVGYADGYRRTSGNRVLVHGIEVPVVGRVCMDQILVQLDEIPAASSGDEVVLLGKQGEAQISAETIARRWGTINYEVVSGIAARVPRVYTRRTLSPPDRPA